MKRETIEAGEANSIRASGNVAPDSLAKVSRGVLVRGLSAVVIPLAVWFVPLNLDPTAHRALAVSTFMIVAWITEVFSHALTGFVGCYLFWALGVTSFGTAFGGFASESPWFCFGALLFGMMAVKSGLARRLACLLLMSVGHTYSRVILGFVLLSFLLTFLVPSGAACVVIKATIALGLMKAFRLGPGSNVGKGLFVTLTYTAGMYNKLLVAGTATILARGLIEKSAQVEVLWSRWFVAFLPCAVVTLYLTWRLALWLYPPEGFSSSEGKVFLESELRKLGPWSYSEKRAAVFMLVATALWMTDFWHRTPPAMIGLGVGLLAALPGIGFIKRGDLKQLDYSSVFFVAAAVSLGEVLMRTGAIVPLTTAIFKWMGHLVTNTYSLALVPYWTSFVYHLFLGSEIPMLSTSIPPLMHFARSHGLDPLALGMIWTFAAGCKLFVYQSTVLIIGYSYGYFEGRDLFRFGACMAAAESLILFFLVIFYWPLLGIGAIP
jgi:sodium-dependent dicarboxylate transporter 2/3/5